MAPKRIEQQTYQSRITDWPEDERPRERLQKYGADAVSSAELLGILLGQGTARFNAVELARLLLNRFKSLEALSMASATELQEIPGIGPAKAVTLLAAFQLYRNLQQEKAENEIISFRNPAEVAKIYQPLLGNSKQERFLVVLVNTAMQRIMDFEVSRGTLDSSVVHPREVFREAVKQAAKGIIVLHNHPSGQAFPSEADLQVTKKLTESGKILGIELFDHIIITATDFYSFKNNNQI